MSLSEWTQRSECQPGSLDLFSGNGSHWNDGVHKYLSLNFILHSPCLTEFNYLRSISGHLYEGGFQICILITDIFGTADLSEQLSDYTIALLLATNYLFFH